MICKHCKDARRPWKCDLCDKSITDECYSCHRELAHGVIVNQNIHIVSSTGGGKDDDPSQQNNVRHLEDCR